MAERKTSSTDIVITCRPGRDLTDNGWEQFQPADIAVWKEACSCFAARTYQHEQWDITVNIDWRPIVRRLQYNHDVTKRAFSERSISNAAAIWAQYRHSRVHVPCKVLAKSVRKKSAKHFHPSAYVESFVYDVFLALNLALPGSCDFYLSTVTSNLEKFPDKVELSHHWFELSYANTYEGKWPASIQLPLPAVRDWLQQIRSGLAQVPNNQMEKVLFALWHICAASDISPPTVVWLFYALETLFDTQPGENLRALQRRISAMLSATEKDLKILKKELRVLYDLRSSFVHGGLEVIHPMHGTLLDPRADERYWRVAKPCEFGFSVLLRSLQEVIARKWYSVHYKEETIAGDAPANT